MRFFLLLELNGLVSFQPIWLWVNGRLDQMTGNLIKIGGT